MENNNVNVIKEEYSLLSEEDFEKLKQNGVSDEDIEDLKEVCALADTVDLAPKDMNKFMQKFDKMFPETMPMAQFIETYLNLPNTDLKFFQELTSLLELLNPETIKQPSTKVEKVSLSDVNKANTEAATEEVEKNLLEILADFRKLSPEERKTVMNELNKNK